MVNTAPLLSVEQVSYSWQGKRLLAPVSFTLRQGEFLWLTGPSGAGKSTLLKIIASLLEPGGGSIRFNGRPISEIKPETYRQQVSYCFQSPRLFGHSVYDNLALPYQIRQQSPQRPALVASLQRLDLPAGMLDAPITQLSGGEMQRVALLRNLQFPPAVLLLDEVTSALDDANKQRVQQLIEHQVEQGVAVVWISHDTREMANGSRVLTLSPVSTEGALNEPA